jgi:hypothetical protein
MTPRFIKKSNIDDELAKYYAFIVKDKLEPAEQFLVVAFDSFQRLSESPLLGRELGSVKPKLAGLRVYPMPAPYRNYLVIYRPIPEGVFIISVVNGYRDYEVFLARH